MLGGCKLIFPSLEMKASVGGIYSMGHFHISIYIYIYIYGSVHILYNADGVGGGFRFCYTVLYRVGGWF